MKIIFLDIDGVLVNTGAYSNGLRPDPACVGRLNSLVEETGAVIVVSSIWRKMGLEEVREALGRWGVKGEIVGVTPMLEKRVKRGEEIRTYLMGAEEVESIVILDDDDDMGNLKGRLVQTDSTEGLSAEDVVRAQEMLG